MRSGSIRVAAIGGVFLLAAGACALPRERKEVLGAEPQVTAGTPAVGGSGDNQASAAVATSAGAAAPSVVGSPAPSGPVTLAADGGVTTPTRPTLAQTDAAMPADAGPDECGEKFTQCFLSDPLNFEVCATRYCRALVPMGAATTPPDGGVTREAACAMQFAECLTRDPQKTAECMAMAQQCM